MEPRTVRIAVAERIRVWRADLPLAADEDLRVEFTRSNPKHHKLKAMGKWTGGEPAHVETFRVEGGWLTLPRGGRDRVREVLARCGLSALVRDDRSTGSLPAPAGRLAHALRPYQLGMVDAAEEAETCIVRAPTGSGKTYAAFGLVERLGVATLVLVSDGALMRQWRRRATSEFGVPARLVGQIGAGAWDARPLTVATCQTLAARDGEKLEKVAPLFGAVVFDEVQRAAAPTVYRVVDRLPCRWRIGISADERRKDGQERLIRDVFGPVAHEVSERDVLESGAVVPVDVVLAPTGFAAPWYDAQARHHESLGIVPADLDDDYGRLLDEMCASEERTRVALDLVRWGVKHRQPTVLLTSRVEHARRVVALLAERGVECGLLVGGKENAAEYDRTTKGLAARRLFAAAGTVEAFGTGLDVATIERVVLARPLATNRMLLNQVKGRACRPAPNKTRAQLFYLLDEAVFPEAEASIRRWFPNRVRRLGDEPLLLAGMG